MRTPRLETARLVLREVQPNDVAAIFNCWMQDEEVSRYMWWKASEDIEEARGFVDFELEQRENPLWKRWIVELREEGTIIGTVLVFFNDEDAEAHWDISYNLGRKYWGKGYTTEAMTAALKFAAEAMGVQECVTTYAKVNNASERVLRKLGFETVRELPYVCSAGELTVEGIECRLVLEKKRTIIKCGSVLENEVKDEFHMGKSGMVQRYWINLGTAYPLR